MDGFSACSWTKMLPWQQSSEWIFSSSWGQTADSEDALIRPPPVDASLKIWEYVWHGWKYTQCTWYDKYWHRHCPMTLYYYIVHRIQSKDKNCQELSRIISWTAWSSVTLEIKIIDCTVIHMQKETIVFTHNAEVLTHEPFFPARRSPFVVTACPDCTPFPRLINSSWERDPPLPCHSISFSRAPWEDAETGPSLERQNRTRTKTNSRAMLRLLRVLFT